MCQAQLQAPGFCCNLTRPRPGEARLPEKQRGNTSPYSYLPVLASFLYQLELHQDLHNAYMHYTMHLIIAHASEVHMEECQHH